MDPDPLSLLNFLFSRFFFTFGIPTIIVLITSVLSLVMLILLSGLSRVLKTIGADDLKELEKKEPEIFEKLQSLFNKNDSMSTLFLLCTFLFLILFSVTVFFLLREADFHIITEILLVVTMLFISVWLLPKYLARDADTWVKLGLGGTYGLLNLLTPVSNYFAPPEVELPQDDVSLEDLKTALPDAKSNKPTVANLALYKQVLHFDKLLVKNVMRPQKEIIGIKAIYNFKEVLSKMQKSTFSRLPVYDGSWSNILGIIHCKDLLPYTHKDKLDWNKFIRPIVFVKPDDSAQEILRIFQKSKNHMAIVKDVEDRIAGILTLEDITEEIIGEIEDE